MTFQQPEGFPFYSAVRPETGGRLCTGVAQWQGTRLQQNDVVYLSPEDPGRGLLVAVADGIGLDADAGRAAAAAVSAMRQDFQQNPPMEELHRQTLRMMGRAHAAVREINIAGQQQGLMPVGASAACVLIRNRKLSFSSVGNVRVFLCRAGNLLQLNRDHLLSLEAEEREILRGNAPDVDPEWAKRVTAFVGMEDLQAVDCQVPPVQLVPGDRVLVMSSGLYGVLTEEELCATVLNMPAQDGAEAVVRRVMDRHPDSQSNISIVLVQA